MLEFFIGMIPMVVAFPFLLLIPVGFAALMCFHTGRMFLLTITFMIASFVAIVLVFS